MDDARDIIGKGVPAMRGTATARCLALLAALCASCTAKINDPELDGPPAARVGEVGLSLSLLSGQPVGGVGYTITRLDGFYQRGSIPPGSAGSFSALLALPEARNYTIELTASTMGLHCLGSEHFDVFADRRIAVSVVVRCQGAQGNTGSLQIDGTLNICPTAHAIVANPEQGKVGKSIRLYGTASDVDGRPSPLTYAWSSTSGALGDQRDDSIGFICTEPGIAAVTLVVSDGDTGCETASTTTTVACLDDAEPAMPTAGASGTAGTGTAGATGGTAGTDASGTAGVGADASIPPEEPDDGDAGVAE